MGAFVFIAVSVILFVLMATEVVRRRHAEDGLEKSRALNRALAELVLLQRTDGSPRAARCVREFCRYHPPDVVIHAALHAKAE
jgi:hypothetical protein